MANNIVLLEGNLINYLTSNNITNYIIVTSNPVSFRYHCFINVNCIPNNIFLNNLIDKNVDEYKNKLICFESYDNYSDVTDVCLSTIISYYPDLNILIHVNIFSNLIKNEDIFLNSLNYNYISNYTPINCFNKKLNFSSKDILEETIKNGPYNSVVFVANELVARTLKIELSKNYDTKKILIINRSYKFVKNILNTIFLVIGEYNFGFNFPNVKQVWDSGKMFLFVNSKNKFTRFNSYDINLITSNVRRNFVNIENGTYYYILDPIEEIYRETHYKVLSSFIIKLNNKGFDAKKIFTKISTKYNYKTSYDYCIKNNLFEINSNYLNTLLISGSDSLYELLCLEILKHPDITNIDKYVLLYTVHSVNYNILKLSSNDSLYSASPFKTLYKIWKLILLNNKITLETLSLFEEFCKKKNLSYDKIMCVMDKVKPMLKKSNIFITSNDFKIKSNEKCLDIVYSIMCKYFDTEYKLNKIENVFFSKEYETIDLHKSVCCHIKDKCTMENCVVLLSSQTNIYFFHTLEKLYTRQKPTYKKISIID